MDLVGQTGNDVSRKTMAFKKKRVGEDHHFTRRRPEEHQESQRRQHGNTASELFAVPSVVALDSQNGVRRVRDAESVGCRLDSWRSAGHAIEKLGST